MRKYNLGRFTIGLLPLLLAACQFDTGHMARSCRDIRVGDHQREVLDACGAPSQRRPSAAGEAWMYGEPSRVLRTRIITLDPQGFVISVSDQMPEPDPRNLHRPQ